MPSRSTHGQPDPRHDWFASAAGIALLQSEHDSVRATLGERPGQPWLWLAPAADDAVTPGHGLRLCPGPDGWRGSIRCALPLPLANESVAVVILQHLQPRPRDARALLDECARVLVPGGQLALFCLNPLSPYRWRWFGQGVHAAEPMPWRRRLRAAGLQPTPVSQGLGPRWRVADEPQPQHGPGLRAAWMLRAEKRHVPLTPVRGRAPLRIGSGVPAA